MYKPSEKEEFLATQIVDAAYTVHKTLGPGLLERVYEVCFCHELGKRNVRYLKQLDFPIQYDGISFQEALRLDVVVDDLVICELKAAEQIIPLFEAQLMTYLKLTGRHLGFLINFNVPLIKNGIKRIIMK